MVPPPHSVPEQITAATIRRDDEPYSELVISGPAASADAMGYLREHLKITRESCPVLMSLERTALVLRGDDLVALEDLTQSFVKWRIAIVVGAGIAAADFERMSAACGFLANVRVFLERAPAIAWVRDCAPRHCIKYGDA